MFKEYNPFFNSTRISSPGPGNPEYDQQNNILMQLITLNQQYLNTYNQVPDWLANQTNYQVQILNAMQYQGMNLAQAQAQVQVQGVGQVNENDSLDMMGMAYT